MKNLLKIATTLIILFCLSGCSLFEDECDDTKVPDINYDVEFDGLISHPLPQIPPSPMFIKVEVYKKHCGGHLSSIFDYVCAGSKVIPEHTELACGLGYTFGFNMNNKEDALVITFKFSKVDPPAFGQPFAQRTVNYSQGFQNCPEFPPRSVVYFEYVVDVDYDYENPGLKFFKLAACVPK